MSIYPPSGSTKQNFVTFGIWACAKSRRANLILVCGWDHAQDLPDKKQDWYHIITFGNIFGV
jgi:hypothetical protein